MCGYLRYYYPTEFCTSFLNCAKNDDDIANGTQLAQSKGCKIETPLFRYSTSEYGCDSENKIIYKGIGSIKDIGKSCGDNLYKLKDNKYDTFVDLLYDIFDNGLAKKNEIIKLIKIDYFKEFGNIEYLLNIHNIFQTLKKRSSFKVAECEKYNLEKDEVSLVSNKTTEKQFSGVDMKSLIKIISKKLDNKETPNIDHISYELGILGYTNYYDESIEDGIYAIAMIDENKYGTRFATLYNPKTKEYIQYKINRNSYNDHPCNVGDIIKTAFRNQNKRVKNDDGDWVETDVKETILKDYSVLKSFKE